MTESVKTPILLVDDRPENLTALEGVLEDLGLHIYKASSGNEALRLTLKHDFALVLLDVGMPDMDGFETAELMRSNKKTQNLPIIFVTAGLKESNYQFKGYEAGAVDYLLKPIAPSIVRSKVRIFCDLYRQRRQIEIREQRLEVLITERTADLKHSNEQLNAELALRKRLETRERMRSGVLEKLIQGAALPDVLNSIALGIEAEQKNILGSILLLDESGRHLQHGASPSLPAFYTDAIDGLEIGPTAGSCGTAAYLGKRVIAEDIQTHPCWIAYRDVAKRAGLASCWSEPIIDRQGVVIGTFAIYHREPRAPSPEDLDWIQSLANLAGVIIEHRQTEEKIRKLNVELEQRVRERTRELAESEERFRTIYDTAPVSIWQEDWTEVVLAIEDLRMQGVTDFAAYFERHPEFVDRALNAVKIQDVNLWTLDMFAAKNKAEMLASLGTVFASPDTLPGFVGELIALAQGQSVYRTEMTLNTVKGDLIHTLLAMSFSQPSSALGKVLMSLIDITQRKQAERKVEEALNKEVVLRREIHHRVKNNLQVIISLLYLQSSKMKDPNALSVLRESQVRVRSIALIHEMLYKREDLSSISFNDYVRQLASDLFVAYRIDQQNITLKIGPGEVFFGLDLAIPCGIIVTELMTNALKYAFPQGGKGEIEISLQPIADKGSADNGSLALNVRDNGVGLPKDLDVQRAQTLGLNLVHDLTRQLGGSVEFREDIREPGTEVRVVFPQAADNGNEEQMGAGPDGTLATVADRRYKL